VDVLFAVSFAGIASGAPNPAINIAFTSAIIISYSWLTAVAADLYRRTRTQQRARLPQHDRKHGRWSRRSRSALPSA
jgi:hypothetical protein